MHLARQPIKTFRKPRTPNPEHYHCAGWNCDTLLWSISFRGSE